MTTRKITGALLFMAAALTLAGCSTNPATGKPALTGLSSTASELGVGREQNPKVLAAFGGAYNDSRLQAYVNAVGQRVARTTERPGISYTFTVLNTPIVNALALPGGYVYLTRGLLALAGNEAQLAGVIGHEVAHITALHQAQRQSRQTLATLGTLALGVGVGGPIVRQTQIVAQGFLSAYSRQEEYEADLLGARYMARAGYDPAAMAAFLTRLKAHSRLEAELVGRPAGSVDRFDYLSTHPDTADRIRRAIAAAKVQVIKEPTVGGAAYLAAIDGMLYGEPPEDGFIRGRVFIHPVLKIRFEVPQGFQLFDTPARVYAIGPGNSEVVFDLASSPIAERSMVNYVADIWAKGLSLSAVQPLRVNGLDAATATARIGTPKGPMDMRVVAIRDRSRVYRFRFLTPPALTAKMAAPFGTTVQSFRPFSAAEAATIKPLRIKVITAAPGDTQKALAARMKFVLMPLERLRVLNGLNPGQPLTPGLRIKLISE